MSLVNIPMSLIFSLLVLLIKVHFPKMFKGTLYWFLSLLLPALSLTLLFLSMPQGGRPPLLEGAPILAITSTYLLGNIFLQIGWFQFFGDFPRFRHVALYFSLILGLPMTLTMLNFPGHITFGIFNTAIIFYLTLYLIKKHGQKHPYASSALISLTLTAFLTTFAALLLFSHGANNSPERISLIFSLSYMFRNSLVLFSVYAAVMHRFKTDHQKMAEQQSSLMHELELLSITDSLTGLHNRRGFDHVMTYEYEQAKRGGTGYTITLGDIDFFKQVNDRYGHDCGDKVIRLVADTIRKNIREQDCLARWGGEEFIILQRNNSLQTSADVMERIRKEIENLPITYQQNRFSVTMSFGIAEMAHKTEDYDAVIIEADTKLYKAKHSGRNRIVID